MTDVEISKILNIPSNTLTDWSKKKSKRNPLYTFLSKLKLDEAKKIGARKLTINDDLKFSKKAKTVKLDKTWFYTDLLWSSGNEQRIGINRLISIYMSNPDQRNTDVLIRLFGKERIEEVINNNFDFDENTKRIKEVALEQVAYGHTYIKRDISKDTNLIIDTEKLAKQLIRASQKRIDKIVANVDKDVVMEAAHKIKFPESYAVEDKIQYAIGKII